MNKTSRSLPITHGILWAAAILGSALAGADSWFVIGGLTLLAAVAIGTLTGDQSCRSPGTEA